MAKIKSMTKASAFKQAWPWRRSGSDKAAIGGVATTKETQKNHGGGGVRAALVGQNGSV